MAIPRALVLALDLFRAPPLADVMRSQPLLPSEDMLVLLRIAGGCPQTFRHAVESTGKSSEHIRDAVGLYLTQVLLFPGADSYRILGVDPQASNAIIRKHLYWMMRWLHPDRNRNEWESLFASRVLRAWEDLKSPQRREAYDCLRDRTARRVSVRRRGIPWFAVPLSRSQSGRGWLRALVPLSALGHSAWLMLSDRLAPNSTVDEAERGKGSGAPAVADEPARGLKSTGRPPGN